MALGEMNSGNDIITDVELTQEGVPADAKSVKEQIDNLLKEIAALKSDISDGKIGGFVFSEIPNDDFNQAIKTGCYKWWVNSEYKNGPGTDYGTLVVFNQDNQSNSYVAQIAFGVWGAIKSRARTETSWSAWTTIK